ncbi:MAG TPA: GAF domain-containing protein, partial [Holophaga sp.]|nr:GAF domain-containing protein [Holophaga sp.]
MDFQSNSPERWLALADLASQSPHATHLFNRGLDLLVKALAVDRAALTRVSPQGLETCWWALGGNVGAEDAIHETDEFFGPRIMDAPSRTLLVADLAADPELAAHPSARRLGIRTYLGIPLLAGGACLGILSLQSLQPLEFSGEAFAFVRIL